MKYAEDAEYAPPEPHEQRERTDDCQRGEESDPNDCDVMDAGTRQLYQALKER